MFDILMEFLPFAKVAEAAGMILLVFLLSLANYESMLNFDSHLISLFMIFLFCFII